MVLRIFCLVACLIFPLAVAPQTRRPNNKPAAKKVVYACPMHPDYTSSKPGRCPLCGMELRQVKPEPSPSPSPTPANVGEVVSPTSSFSSTKIPNTRIYDQDGKQLNFYNDLVKGKTVAELGNMNRPLDMIAYQKDGKDYLLLANSARGIMKVSTDKIEETQPITQHISDKAGLTYETINDVKGVEQLAAFDANNALIVRKTESGQNLETLPLP